MKRIAFPRYIVLFVSLSLWSVAFQATLDGESVSQRRLYSHGPLVPVVAQASEEKVERARLDERTPIRVAAAGHWF